MARTGVHIKLSDTQLGTATPNDSIVMLFAPITSGASAPTLLYNEPYLLTQLNDLTIHNITSTNAPEMYGAVSDFYTTAGPGYKLWIVAVADDPDSYDTIFTDGTFATIVKKTAVGNFDNRPRIVGFKGKATWASAPVVAGSLNSWAYNLAPTLGTAMEGLFAEGYGLVSVLDGIEIDTVEAGINSEANLTTTLQNLGILKQGMIAIQVTTNELDKTAAIGQTLGQLASVPISTSIGAVSLGPIGQTGYFLDKKNPSGGKAVYINTPVQAAKQSVIDTLGDYQYLFTRVRVSSATSGGVYYNDGATANSNEYALSSLEFGRVANAVCDDVRGFFNVLINQGVPYDPTTGELDSGFVDTMIADLRAKYLNRRIINGEMQDVRVSARATNGDYPATKSIDVTVRIYPVIALQQVFAEVTFTVSA